MAITEVPWYGMHLLESWLYNNNKTIVVIRESKEGITEWVLVLKKVAQTMNWLVCDSETDAVHFNITFNLYNEKRDTCTCF